MTGDRAADRGGEHAREGSGDVEGSAARVRTALIEVGRRHGGSFSWHRTDDTFEVLVAEYLLRRTTRKVVDRVFPRIIARYPTATDLAGSDPEELWALASSVGLRKRTLALREIAQKVVERGGMASGEVDREFLLGLPYVGPYIADAVALYAYDEMTFPLDGNARRVVYRMMLGDDPPRALEAYDDQVLLTVSGHLSAGVLDPKGAREIHQGMLYIAWHSCRPRPLCPECLVRQDCLYGSAAPSLR